MRLSFIGPAQWATAAAVAVALAIGASHTSAQEELFKSRRVNPDTKGEYTRGIEGPAVDADGNLYVTNFAQQGTIGRLKPGAQKSELFATLDNGSIGSGIRFDKDGRMYIADFKKNNVLVIEKGANTAKVYLQAKFNQPNDLAIARDGTLYASDPLRKKGLPVSGRVWRITRGADGKAHGEIMSSQTRMRATNGIDLSPDEKTLYVGEADTNILWAYRIDGTSLTGATKVTAFDTPPKTFDIDGLRTDMDGRIYVTQNGAGMVVVLKPDGTVVQRIQTLGKNPSNLTFGGPDGRTVFVTQVDGGFIESFRVDRPGREPCMQLGGAFC